MANSFSAVSRFSTRTDEEGPSVINDGGVGMNATNKKDDDFSTIATNDREYRWDLAKKICSFYVLYPAVVLFALIGLFTVAEDIGLMYSGGGSGYAPDSASVMETKDPENDLFDGHIRTDQTKGHGRIREYIGREKPFGDGGESIINRLLNHVEDAKNVHYYEDDVPFYWEIGFSGHSSIESKLCQCLDIHIASSAGSNEAGNADMLEPLAPAAEGNLCKVYNVDMGTHQGTQRAKGLGFLNKVIPDFISSPFLPEILSLFTAKNRGQLLTSIPQVMPRTQSSYRYLRDHGIFHGTYLEFISSDHILANNYMVHMLSGKWGGVQELTEDDLMTAYKVLNEKFIIFRWSDTRKVVEYLVKNERWDAKSIECMYPPEVVKKDAELLDKRRHGPKPEKKPEELAEEMAAQQMYLLHNVWDRKLYDMLVAGGFV